VPNYDGAIEFKIEGDATIVGLNPVSQKQVSPPYRTSRKNAGKIKDTVMERMLKASEIGDESK